MNIYFLSSRYPPDFIGGGEWSTKYIAEALAALGENVTVVAGSKEDKDEIINGVKILRRKNLHGLWEKPLFEEQKSETIAKELENIIPKDADLVHAHDFRSALALSKLPRKNKFVTIRDYAPICGTTNNMWYDGRSCDGCSWNNVLFKCHRVKEASLPRKPFRVWQYKYNLSFRNSVYESLEKHIYISEALKNRISSRLKIPVSSVVIPNPVGDGWLAPVKESGKNPLIIYAGTVEKYKGIEVLNDAFKKVLEKIPNAHLKIIGGKEKKDQSYVRQRFDEAWVVVQPSLWEEPFGRTVIEGMARGRAVVASNIGGLKEIVTENCGKLVPPGNPEKLAESLLEILTDSEKRKAMGEAGRKRVEENYSGKIVGQKYLEFYKTKLNQ